MQYSPLREAWKSYLHFAHTSNKLWKRLKTHHLYYFWLLRKLDWNITNCINPSAKNSTEIKKGVTKLRHGILSTLSTTAQIYHLTKDISIALMTAGVTTALAIPNLFSTSHIIWAKQSLINCSQSSKITENENRTFKRVFVYQDQNRNAKGLSIGRFQSWQKVEKFKIANRINGNKY